MSSLFSNARALSEQKKSMLVEMLDSVFDNLDLTKTQRERIETAYNAVGSYLASCDHPLLEGAQIYPQGSMRLRTTNKPLGQEEFDVDQRLRAGLSAQQVKEVIPEAVFEKEGYLMLNMDVLKEYVREAKKELKKINKK